ncbi:hypothetical protein CSKR_103922 [Clonorchis sinensis]|uniref:Uncharacterized protein n=2 Tax=Clonorchis sinensis TaxID=79923 RepID=A0A8T1MRM3_CLOSI|nr:hypothetical protein CSKR_103922 [Clonorchis sinensis]GAA47246.1 hypothetical protein CLF_100127 [Clonorchis sinensis]
MRFTCLGAGFFLLILIPLTGGNSIRVVGFQVHQVRLSQEEFQWVKFLEEWSVQNISAWDICDGIHQLKKILTDRFFDFPLLFCVQSPQWEKARDTTTLTLYFDARNLQTDTSSLACHAEDLEFILNNPEGSQGKKFVTVNAWKNTMEIYATILNVERHPNQVNDFWRADHQMRKELAEEAVMSKPLALFAATTENPFNENYFAIFEEDKLPLTTWDADAEWKQIMYSTFSGGAHLRSIADWYMVDLILLQPKLPPKSQGKCIPQKLTTVTVININATLPGESTSTAKTYADVLPVLEGGRWTVIGKLGIQREAFHVDLTRVSRGEISCTIYVTGINQPLRVVAKTAHEEAIEVRSFSLAKLEPNCILHKNVYSLKVSVILFVPIGNQKLSAADLPAFGSVEYNNMLEFTSIYLREDLLAELGLGSSMLWAEIQSLKAFGQFVIAKGTAHFNTVRLTGTHADLEREHLIGSFNRKFKPTNSLILRAQYIENDFVVCGASALKAFTPELQD